MTWVSERHLVAAISNAGGFGVIACGAMTPDLLDTEIAETKKRTKRPFGVNLITMHPDLFELIDTCAKHGVTHVVLAGGLPPGGAIDRIKSSGAKLIGFAPALSPRQETDALGRRRFGHRGHGSRRPHRPGRRPRCWRRKSCPTSPTTFRCSSPAASGAAKRSPLTSKWARSGSSSAPASSARPRASPTPTSRRSFIRASARDAIPSVQIDPRLPVIPVRALEEPRDGEFRRETARSRANA